MATVYLSSTENSTMFTTCCRTAIRDDQGECPRCGEAVTPLGARARWEAAYGPTRATNK